MGLTPPTLQAYVGDDEIKLAPTLKTVADVVEFFQTKANFPIFGKPRFGSRGIDGFQVTGLSEDGKLLQKSDGTTAGLQDTAAEITERYGSGFLLQSAVHHNQELERTFGNTSTVLRIVTIKPPAKPAEVLYMIIRAAPPDNMGVMASVHGTYNSELDPTSGRLTTPFWSPEDYYSDGLQDETALGVHWSKVQLPMIAEARDAALTVHAHFAAVSILGFDIILSDDGPILLEGNYRPYTAISQRLRDTGLLDARFDDRLSKLVSENQV